MEKDDPLSEERLIEIAQTGSRHEAETAWEQLSMRHSSHLFAYLIPYIDCGVGIEAEGGNIRNAGGRVVVWVPGRPCLMCAGEINPRVAAEELESPEQQRFRKEYGYVAGADVPEPTVISLNGTIASLAVTEFLSLVTGFKEARHYIFYDMIEQRVVSRTVSHSDRCVACGFIGMGNRADIARYSRFGLPKDLSLLN